MSDGQARVLVLLGVLLGLEILFSPPARQVFHGIGAALASWLAPVTATQSSQGPAASGGGGSAGGF